MVHWHPNNRKYYWTLLKLLQRTQVHSVNTNRPLQFTPSYLVFSGDQCCHQGQSSWCWENLQWESDKKQKMNISTVWSSILIVCSQCNRSSKAISLLLAAPLVSYRVSHNIAKCQFLDGCQVWPQLSHLFLNQFSKVLWLSCSKFRGLLKKHAPEPRKWWKTKWAQLLWDTL